MRTKELMLSFPFCPLTDFCQKPPSCSRRGKHGLNARGRCFFQASQVPGTQVAGMSGYRSLEVEEVVLAAISSVSMESGTVNDEEAEIGNADKNLAASLGKPLPQVNSEIVIGGKLQGFRNAWRHNRWALLVVSQDLTWGWFPTKPKYKSVRGYTPT